MIDRASRPRLAAKARLRTDGKSGRYMLLYPERGMELNGTGAAIVQLCTGMFSVDEIIDTLCERYTPTPRDTIEREVLSFLETLASRALLESE
jgi:coenzyme PQQ biosynthesis protein PqqD